MCRSSRVSAANVAAARRTTSARSSGCRFNRIFPEIHALDVEQIIDQMCDVVDLPRDHVVRAGFRLALGVRHLEHLGGSADRAERIAQLVGQQCQELVFRAAVVLGTVAVAVGLEELRHVRHDQVPAIAVGRPGRGERQTHLEGT